MPYNQKVNLVQLAIGFQTRVFNRYPNTLKIYQKMSINLLIYPIPSNYHSLFKNLIIWSNSEEQLKRYYQSIKSKIKIPMKAIYYKNYLHFFVGRSCGIFILITFFKNMSIKRQRHFIRKFMGI